MNIQDKLKEQQEKTRSWAKGANLHWPSEPLIKNEFKKVTLTTLEKEDIKQKIIKRVLKTI